MSIHTHRDSHFKKFIFCVWEMAFHQLISSKKIENEQRVAWKEGHFVFASQGQNNQFVVAKVNLLKKSRHICIDKLISAPKYRLTKLWNRLYHQAHVHPRKRHKMKKRREQAQKETSWLIYDAQLVLSCRAKLSWSLEREASRARLHWKPVGGRESPQAKEWQFWLHQFQYFLSWSDCCKINFSRLRDSEKKITSSRPGIRITYLPNLIVFSKFALLNHFSEKTQ